MVESKKVPTLAEVTKKKEEVAPKEVKEEKPLDHVDPPGYRDGVRLGAAPPNEAQLKQIEAASGEVHVWEEDTSGDLARVYPGFEPQKMNSDQIGTQDE